MILVSKDNMKVILLYIFLVNPFWVSSLVVVPFSKVNWLVPTMHSFFSWLKQHAIRQKGVLANMKRSICNKSKIEFHEFVNIFCIPKSKKEKKDILLNYYKNLNSDCYKNIRENLKWLRLLSWVWGGKLSSLHSIQWPFLTRLISLIFEN